MNLKVTLSRAYWLLSDQFGIDPRKMFRSVRGLPRFVRDYRRFRSGYNGPLELRPCLQDWFEKGGAAKLEYFWQDLLVARKIFAARPQRHVDIGSRVDGFVAHVASFRNIEVFDLRPINVEIPGVTFRQADLMQTAPGMKDYCDSLSCLHALEHFGLGRYGDPIDARGFERGFANMAALLKEGGTFYLSVPIGIPRVEFNGQRVLDPRTVMQLAADNSLAARDLALIRAGGKIELLAPDQVRLADVARERYALGLFTFEKRA
jgi:SAM-dependent methyltransferase